MDEVRAQYEAYPYPARDPKEEARRLVVGSPGALWEVDHFLFAGRLRGRSGFRALFAGGGTGDGTIMLAQQMKDARIDGEVVWLDPSAAARRVAEGRAKARRLTNIRFHTGSLLDLPELGLGAFDYIDCCGVLHHLPDPPAGLTALTTALAPGGGLGLMVYGTHGRAGVYEAQAMLRTLTAGLAPAERVKLARKLLATLPPSNGLRRNPFVRDHLDGGDAGLYDLLLHGQDRAYTVPELYALLDGAGLVPTGFMLPAAYEPGTYLNDPALLARLAALGPRERHAFAEQLAGNMKTHVVYAVRAAEARGRLPDPGDPAMVPVLAGFAAEPARLAAAGAISASLDGAPVRFALPRLGPAMLARIDGERSLGEIHADLRGAHPGLDWSDFAQQFQALWRALHGLGKLFLRDPRQE